MKKKEARTKLFMVVYAVMLLVVSVSVTDCSEKKNDRSEKTSLSLPEAVYTLSPDSFPFRFKVSGQAEFSARKTKEGEYFCDLDYPGLQAHIYCTWHSISPGSFPKLAEESHRLAYQHTSVADAIKEKMYSDDSRKAYGILYDIEGKVATPLQVGLTDSVSYFFNASLYFDGAVNSDSIAPVLDYIRKDVVRMMESFQAKR